MRALLCVYRYTYIKKVYIEAQLNLEQILNEIICFFCWIYMVQIGVTAFQMWLCILMIFSSRWYCSLFVIFISYMYTLDCATFPETFAYYPEILWQQNGRWRYSEKSMHLAQMHVLNYKAERTKYSRPSKIWTIGI